MIAHRRLHNQRSRIYNCMKADPLPACLCPHGWRKFEQAQWNMMRFMRRRGPRNWRRSKKWAHVMGKWIARIYVDLPGIYSKNQ